jgi:SAM-dependent methyltransferase
MFEYQALFDERGELYNEANALFPEARQEEASGILAHLTPGVPWLDVCSGGGYLSLRAAVERRSPARFSCDGSLHFLRARTRAGSACVTRPEALPFADGAVGGAACLAALHHSEEPAAVVAELLRVSRPGGRAAVADVAEGSKAARFLNGFIDRHTTMGHRGRFYDLQALSGFLSQAGGLAIRAERAEINWRFPGRADALLFCRKLFGLQSETPTAEIDRALDGLGAEANGGGFRVPWTMLFASAERA